MAIVVTGAGKPGGSPAVKYFGTSAATSRQLDDEGVAFAGSNLNAAITQADVQNAIANNVNGGPQATAAIRVNATNRRMVP